VLVAATTTGTPPTVRAAAAFLFDPTRGLIFYQKDADVEHSMASTTKVMTLLLAVERGGPDQIVTIGPDAAALVNSDNSHMGVSAGEEFSLSDLLYGLVLPSGNDVAVAIADAISGNVPSFVALMNQRAQQLGLTHTHYVSPDGLDDANITSAHDLALLMSTVMRYPEAVRVMSTLHYTIPRTANHKAYSLWSGNDLLSGARSPYPGALGKPGFTYAARYCQAFAALRHGHVMVGAVLGDWSWKDRIADMRALLDWGFTQVGIPPAPAPVPWAPISPNA
jgi:D-alanyl-D-alanine carboxypeptidase (penicillin-binding protein 5/6)